MSTSLLYLTKMCKGAPLCLCIILPVSLAGCAQYTPKELCRSPQSVALAPNDKLTLQHQIHEFHHPVLKPITLDFTQPLTPEQIAVLSVILSPDLKAARTALNVAQAQVFNAGLLPDPQVSYNLNTPLTLGNVNAWSVNIGWDIFSAISNYLAVDSANFKQQQVMYDLAWQEWLTANQAQLLAIRISCTNQQIDLAKASLNTTKKILDLAKKNLEKRNITIDTFMSIQAQYTDLNNQILTLKRTLATTKGLLNQLLGLSYEETLAIKHKAKSMPKILDKNTLINSSLQQRLDLIALKAGYSSQEIELQRAILGQFPHFNLGLNKQKDTSAVYSRGYTISFDLPIFNRNRGAIAINEATRDKLHAEYNARIAKTISDIAMLFEDLQILQHNYLITSQELNDLSKSFSFLDKELALGNINIINYGNLKANMFNKQTAALQLEQSIQEQLVALQIATGGLIDA